MLDKSLFESIAAKAGQSPRLRTTTCLTLRARTDNVYLMFCCQELSLQFITIPIHPKLWYVFMYLLLNDFMMSKVMKQK